MVGPVAGRAQKIGFIPGSGFSVYDFGRSSWAPGLWLGLQRLEVLDPASSSGIMASELGNQLATSDKFFATCTKYIEEHPPPPQ